MRSRYVYITSLYSLYGLSINTNLVIDVPSYHPRHERRCAAGIGATDGAETVSGNYERCLRLDGFQ